MQKNTVSIPLTGDNRQLKGVLSMASSSMRLLRLFNMWLGVFKASILNAFANSATLTAEALTAEGRSGVSSCTPFPLRLLFIFIVLTS